MILYFKKIKERGDTLTGQNSMHVSTVMIRRNRNPTLRKEGSLL